MGYNEPEDNITPHRGTKRYRGNSLYMELTVVNQSKSLSFTRRSTRLENTKKYHTSAEVVSFEGPPMNFDALGKLLLKV